MQRFDYRVAPEHDGMRLEWYLRKHHSYSRRSIVHLKHTQMALQIDGHHARAIDPVTAGCVVTVIFPDECNIAEDCDIAVPVVYEDERVMVFCKPPGMATHQTLKHPAGTLSNVFATHMRGLGLDVTFRVLNRLDRDTSGLVVVGKDMHAAARLTETGVDKRYFAVCEGGLTEDEGIIDRPIAKVGQHTTLRCVSEEGRPAVTRYRVLARGCDRTLLFIRLLTGRTHQIRVHFSSQGNPLMGDDMYGGGRGEIGRQALHCGLAAFRHPDDGRAIFVEAPLPPDMAAVLPDAVTGVFDGLKKGFMADFLAEIEGKTGAK